MTKKDIARKITLELNLSNQLALDILDSTLGILKKSMHKNIKISKFGTFKTTISPKRIGRNPKTMEEYTINPYKRITFKTSNEIKKYLN